MHVFTKDVRVHRLNADGSLSDTMIVNTTTDGRQSQLSVAWNGRGAGDDADAFTQRNTTTPPVAPAASMSLDPASVDFLMSGDTTKR